jgi:hypothetical protein
LFGSLIADAQAHEHLAELKPGDEAIRSLARGLAQLLERLLYLEVDTKGHAIEHADFRNMRFQFDGAAKLRDEACALIVGERAGIPEHPLQRAARLGADRRWQ